jgi:hypothetical protein
MHSCTCCMQPCWAAKLRAAHHTPAPSLPPCRIRRRDCKHIKLVAGQLGISEDMARWRAGVEGMMAALPAASEQDKARVQEAQARRGVRLGCFGLLHAVAFVCCLQLVLHRGGICANAPLAWRMHGGVAVHDAMLLAGS